MSALCTAPAVVIRVIRGPRCATPHTPHKHKDTAVIMQPHTAGLGAAVSSHTGRCAQVCARRCWQCTNQMWSIKYLKKKQEKEAAGRPVSVHCT